MKKPKKPGGASPGYGSPGYGSPPGHGGGDRRDRADQDTRASGDFGASIAPRGGRRGPGAGRRRQAGGGFGNDYDDGFHGHGDHDDRDGGY